MDGFRFVMPYDVRVADVNYGGHVSNAAVLSFFQDARIAWLNNIGCSELDLGGCGIILPEAHVFYRKVMFLGDRLQIGVRAEIAGKSSFKMLYRIERDGVVTTEGNTALVAFDYARRKPVRLPEGFVVKLSAFEESA
jgi:acyl-CoA thioesterase FadM